MKSIVVYFSKTGENYSNGSVVNLSKGNTEVAAEFIRDITGADLFHIEPTTVFPTDYYACTDVAKEEMNANARPELKRWPATDLSEYDVVYVGYPIWWGTFPMAVFTFLEKYNWAGKTIMPFSTHEGSGLGHSESDIKRICTGADVKRGLAIHGTGVKSSKGAIEKWIKSNLD